MDMTNILLFFSFSFLMNVFWEFKHCSLYETCQRMERNAARFLLISMSLKDGMITSALYILSETVSGGVFAETIAIYSLASIGFAFVDERVSTGSGRWSYAESMPTVLGVGLSPLLQLFSTGVLSAALVFLFPL